MGQPTNVLTISTQYNGNNSHCNGPHLEDGKGTGGACRNIIRRTHVVNPCDTKNGGCSSDQLCEKITEIDVKCHDLNSEEEKCVERCGTDYDRLATSGHNRSVLVKTVEECRKYCGDKGDYAYGLECPITHNSGHSDIECFCFPRKAWTLEKNILPLTECMGKPTNVLTVATQHNGTNRHCSGPYFQNGKGTGGACRNIIRRTNVPSSGFNKNNKEPLELLGKIESRYKKFMTEFIPNKPGIIKAVSNRVSKITDQMEEMYKKLNPKCDFYETSSEDDTERFNRDDPCKGVKTLESVLLNWTKAYSLNCNNQAASGNWLKRMERAAERTSQKLRKNVGKCA